MRGGPEAANRPQPPLSLRCRAASSPQGEPFDCGVGAHSVRPYGLTHPPNAPGGYGIRPYGANVQIWHNFHFASVGEHLAGKTMPASQQSWPARAVQCPAGALIVARPRNSICSRAIFPQHKAPRANSVRPYTCLAHFPSLANHPVFNANLHLFSSHRQLQFGDAQRIIEA